MEPTKDADPIGLPDWGAAGAGDLHELLEALPSGDHVYNVAANLYNELLR